MKKRQGFQLKRAVGTTIFINFSLILLDAVRRAIVGDSLGQVTTVGKFKDPNIAETISSTVIVNTDTSTTINTDIDETIIDDTENSALTVSSSENLGQGSLILISSQYISQTLYTGICDLSLNKNEYYDIPEDSSIFLSSDVVSHLNQMMQDYFTETEKENMIVYRTTESDNSLYDTEYAESSAGYSFDLAIMSSYDEIIEYDGLDTESWISENCYKYGFVVRYPQDKEEETGIEYSPYHFRYVGLPHSMIMNENNMCLEEYTEFLKDYTPENPLVYTVDETEYSIYYVENTPPSTEIPLENSSDYEISGNNYDGYIITVKK